MCKLQQTIGIIWNGGTSVNFFKNKYNDVRAVWKLMCVIPTFFILTVMLTICFTFFYEIILAATTGINDPMALEERIVNSDISRMSIAIIQNIVMMASVMMFWKSFDKKPFSQMGLTFNKTSFIDLVHGLILGAASIALVFVALLLTGQFTVESSVMKPGFASTLLSDLVVMIFVGIGEEMFSRGYCMGILRRSNIFIVLIVPNLIFALLHIFNNNIGVIPMINLFLIGLLFSLISLRRGNIWMPVGYHITWNFFQGSIFGMPVSGSDASGLFASKPVGENIFNGGGFGPEGGLLVTGLIIVSIALLLIFTKNRDKGGAVAADTEVQSDM
jgi:membrane protease YdiL (CAAX protease family)